MNAHSNTRVANRPRSGRKSAPNANTGQFNEVTKSILRGLGRSDSSDRREVPLQSYGIRLPYGMLGGL